jgi:hypothetical protein
LPMLVGSEVATPQLEWRDSFLNHALESLPVRLKARSFRAGSPSRG